MPFQILVGFEQKAGKGLQQVVNVSSALGLNTSWLHLRQCCPYLSFFEYWAMYTYSSNFTLFRILVIYLLHSI